MTHQTVMLGLISPATKLTKLLDQYKILAIAFLFLVPINNTFQMKV